MWFCLNRIEEYNLKYVAFLDILGFKSKLNTFSTHDKAINYISRFSSIVYKEFVKLKATNNVKGYIISDSVILYSTNTEPQSLMNLMNLINNICRAAFKANILIRGGLAKGDFDRVPASELENLEKGLIVGEAFVKAFAQERFVKAIGIIVSKDVKDDIFKYIENNDERIKKDLILLPDGINLDREKKQYYLFKYIDIDFLSNSNNLKSFISMAIDAKYLPHYYNTLYVAVKDVEKDLKVKKLFCQIVKILGELGSNNEDLVNKFVKNASVDKVEAEFQLLLAQYIERVNYRLKADNGL